jgi:CDP-6-deoxy-D-xylo-4-hexulose-3-dehydrase
VSGESDRIGRLASLRGNIESLVREYCELAFAPQEFDPEVSPVPVSGKVFDGDEMWNLVDSGLDFWLTTGRFAEQFETDFARFMSVKNALLCNSGSSANLLAMSALTSPRLKERALKPGDEVITVAAGFPTTINPILQNQLTPVMLDVRLGTFDADPETVREAIGPRTRAIMMAHTLGNPFELTAMRAIADEHELFLIEDTCDAVGATVNGVPAGSVGDLATVSFYPAHHITMGEGGAVLTNSGPLRKIVESYRDWGRDCWCAPGRDNTCGKRFDWQLGELPDGYDHKYIYSHIGYNLKATDMQAAVGLAQLKKLPQFIAARRRNWSLLNSLLQDLDEFFLFPAATDDSEPSWFGYLLTIKDGAPFTRTELIRHLEDNRIATRLLFGGNILKQPAYAGQHFRVHGDLKNSDIVTNRSFWIGIYPGLTDRHLGYVSEIIHQFTRSR